MYVIGNNDTKVYLGNTGIQSGIKDHNEFISRLTSKVAIENDIDPSKVAVFFFDDESAETERIMNFDSFDLVWAGTEPDVIIGVDFSPEDNKKYVKVITDKENIEGDGIDKANLTFTVYLPDKVTVATDVNVTKLVPIDTPTKRIKMQISFVNGVATKEFKKSEDLMYGEYTFPALIREFNGNIKVLERAKVNIYVG